MGFIWDLSRIYPVLDLDPSLSCVHISKKKVYRGYIFFSDLCSVFAERMSHNDFFSGASTFHVKIFETTHFFIGNSIFNLSLELLTKFWKMRLKVA